CLEPRPPGRPEPDDGGAARRHGRGSHPRGGRPARGRLVLPGPVPATPPSTFPPARVSNRQGGTPFPHEAIERARRPPRACRPLPDGAAVRGAPAHPLFHLDPWRTIMRTPTAVVLASIVWLGVPAGSAAQSEQVHIEEWTVPWERSRPRDPYVGPDGRVWFVGQVGNYVAYLEPRSGEFKRYELDEGVHPHNVIVDAQGTVWYAGNQAAHIGKLDPKSGQITQFPMPNPAVRDPHTLIFDQNGDIWFTAQGGNHVGKLTVKTGEVELIPVPIERSRPYGIAIDSK